MTISPSNSLSEALALDVSELTGRSFSQVCSQHLLGCMLD